MKNYKSSNYKSFDKAYNMDIGYNKLEKTNF